MAYDPRTGITTYGETDPAADPTVDAAADVAPSTATALAPEAPGFNPISYWGSTPYIPAEYADAILRQIAGDAAVQDSYLNVVRPGQARAYAVPGLDNVGVRRVVTAPIPMRGQTTSPISVGSLMFQQLSDPSGSSFSDVMGGMLPADFADILTGGQVPYNSYLLGTGTESGAQPGVVPPNISETLAGLAETPGGALWLGAVGGLAGAAVAPSIAAATGGGALGTTATGAATGAITSALSGGDTVRGALGGGLSAGLSSYGAPVAQSALSTFSPDIQFADILGEGAKRPGMLGSGLDIGAAPSVFDGAFGSGLDPLLATETAGALGTGLGAGALDLSPYSLASTGLPASATVAFEDPINQLLSAGSPDLGLNLNAAPVDTLGADVLGTGISPSAPFQDAMGPGALGSGLRTAGMLNSLTAAPGSDPYSITSTAMPASATATFTPPSELPAGIGAQAPSTMDRVERLAKIGSSLAKMYEGQGVPEDAPQRSEGQSDADYAQSLASYVNVDAAKLAEMGLVPGTPEYYDYLMSQLDATIEQMSGTVDVNAADLEQQLRGKTREEITALRRALYVRGQLDQLMGSGSYTDPFTGKTEEVITNGRRVNPGVAAYHRGLGRTIEDFAGLSPIERRQAIGDFLGRDADIYGMQARADARAEQVAQAQAMLEDLKRRRGMFSTSQSYPQFSVGTTGDPALDSLLGIDQYDPEAALRAMFGQ